MTNFYIYADDFYVRCLYPSQVPGWEGEVRIEARPGLLFTRAIAGTLKVRMGDCVGGLETVLVFVCVEYCYSIPCTLDVENSPVI